MAVCSLWILCGVALLAVKDGSGLIIGGCEQGSVDVVEDTEASFTCDAQNNLLLTVYNDMGQNIFSGSCLTWTCTPWNNTFMLSAEQWIGVNYLRYRLTIKRVSRSSARYLFCNDFSTYARCDLRIIDAPYQVNLNHNCPKYVFEGSNVRCTCYASKTISPPALLVWQGMNNATLLLKNVSRQLDQRNFKCQLKWGPDGSIKENTSYKITVAYGPTDAVITSYAKKTEDESETILLTCTATDVYPSAVFQWNVTCYNQTDFENSSTCYLNFTHKIENLAILCTASNTYYNQAYASHVYVLPSLGSQQANTGGPNAGLIGGVIAAVLVVLIIIAVLIVYIIKSRKGIPDRERGFLGFFSGDRKHVHQGLAMSKPYAVVNKPKTQTPIIRQAAPSGDMYTVTNTTSSGHVVDDYAAVCKTSNNNTRGTKNIGAHQATQITQGIREPTAALKPTSKPRLTITNKNVQDLHGTGYMNVTEVPTDSGLGVYHVVPWATMSGSTEPDTSEYSVPTISEEEYNELHFEEDRTGQEDQAENYHHLQIT